jgi:hypothetical protein
MTDKTKVIKTEKLKDKKLEEEQYSDEEESSEAASAHNPVEHSIVFHSQNVDDVIMSLKFDMFAPTMVGEYDLDSAWSKLDEEKRLQLTKYIVSTVLWGASSIARIPKKNTLGFTCSISSILVGITSFQWLTLCQKHVESVKNAFGSKLAGVALTDFVALKQSKKNYWESKKLNA